MAEDLKQKEMTSFTHEPIDDTIGKQEGRGSRKRAICEAIVLTVAIGFAWMLLLLPIIFYHLPDEVFGQANKMMEPTSNTTNTTIKCLPYPTENGVCKMTLEDILRTRNCEATAESPLVLRDNEVNARLLIPALMQSPSTECLSAAVPLLCLHLFGLCDSSGVSIQPTSGQCRNVRDNLCSVEWQAAQMFGLELPDCDSFSENHTSCHGNDTNIKRPKLSSVNTSSLPCQTNFFRSEESGGACVADCHTWSQYVPSVVLGTDVAILLSAIIGFIAGTALIIISLLRFKKMYTFPSVFVVYLTCDMLAIETLMIISHFDRGSLYCSDRNLRTSVVHSTPFCTIAGIVFSYTLLQSALWWLFHTSALLWTIKNPVQARFIEKSGKSKYIHISCLVVGVIVPLAPVIAIMTDFAQQVHTNARLLEANATFISGGMGFVMTRFPPILCFGFERHVVFYANLLPISLIFFVGIAELILLFAAVHKQYGLFTEKKSLASRFNIGTPERKILIALCYYVLLVTISIPAFTIEIRISGLFIDQIANYFLCEEQGINPSAPGICDEFVDKFRKFSYPELTATAFVLLNLSPVMFLIYSLSFKEIKEKWTTCQQTRKLHSQSQRQSHSSCIH